MSHRKIWFTAWLVFASLAQSPVAFAASPKSPGEAEACASRLYESGMSTGTRLNRRVWLANIALSTGFVGYLVGQRLLFEPTIKIIMMNEMPRTADFDNHAGDIIVSDLHPVGPLTNVQIAKFWEKLRLRCPADMADSPYYFGLDPRSWNLLVALLGVRLEEGEASANRLSALHLIRETAESDSLDKERLRTIAERLRAPGYFKRAFPGVPAIDIAEKDLPLYMGILAPPETTELKLEPGAKVQSLAGVLDSALKQISKIEADRIFAVRDADERGYRIFVAALAREWSKELENDGREDLVVFAKRISEALLPGASQVSLEDAVAHYNVIRQENFVREFRAIHDAALRSRRNILLVGSGFHRETLEKWLEEMKIRVAK